MNIFKNINWIARLKNPVFWTTVIPAITGMVYAVLGALGVVAPIAESEVLNLVFVVIGVLTTLGVLVDPTTAGLGDSKLAMAYKAPRKDDVTEEEGI